MSHIRDMLYVKQVERYLRRPLTEEELSGEPFEARSPWGRIETFQIPLLRFPWDVLTRPEQLIARPFGDETVKRLLDNNNVPDGAYENL